VKSQICNLDVEKDYIAIRSMAGLKKSNRFTVKKLKSAFYQIPQRYTIVNQNSLLFLFFSLDLLWRPLRGK
jgi:hypothetical protein